jgi:uroporphyrinogen-III synthase
MTRRILYLGLDPKHYQLKVKSKVTHCPIIQIVPFSLFEPSIYETLSNFEQYSHFIVTSKTTVGILKQYLSLLGIGLQSWARKATLAVGQVTAEHLKECGITPIRVAHEETAEGLIDELKQLPLEQSHVFWPHSSQARCVIKEFLVDQEIRHTTCILYETKPCVPCNLPKLENFDEIVFTSPSTIDAFLQIFSAFPSHARLVAIGPITAAFLKKLLFMD